MKEKNGALSHTNTAEFETTVGLGRDQNLIYGEIAPQSKFSKMDPEQLLCNGGALQIVADGGYQNGAVINRDAKFPAVVSQSEVSEGAKHNVSLPVTGQTETGVEQMEIASDFDESFLNADQDTIGTQEMDGECEADVNEEGIDNE